MTKEEAAEFTAQGVDLYCAANPVREAHKSDVRITSMKAIAEYIRSMATAKDQVILVGPPLVYDKDGIDHVMAMTITGAGQVDAINFGRHIQEWEADSPLYQAANTVLVVQRCDEITISQAREKVALLTEEFCNLFEQVEAFSCDKELVKAYVKRFPCAHSRFLAKDILGDA